MAVAGGQRLSHKPGQAFRKLFWDQARCEGHESHQCTGEQPCGLYLE